MMKNTCLINILLFLSLALLANSANAASSKITFVNVDKMPGIEILIEESKLKLPKPIQQDKKNWVYHIDHSHIGWRTDLTFLIKINGDELVGWPFELGTIEIPLSISIRKDEPIDLEIPVSIIRSEQSKDLEQLDLIVRNDRLFEKMLKSAQYSLHYLLIFDNKTKRQVRKAVQLWFDSTVEVIKGKGAFVQISESLYKTTLRSFASNSKARARFKKDYDGFASLFWRELVNEMRGLLDEDHCQTAKELLAYAQIKHQQNPELASAPFLMLKRSGDAELDQWAASIKNSCP